MYKSIKPASAETGGFSKQKVAKDKPFEKQW